MKYYYVYITANKRRTVFYIGITNNLQRRAFEHTMKLNPNSFTAKYNVDELVYFETYTDVREAIAREKEIKKWSRRKKLALIRSMNPEMKKLFDETDSENDTSIH